MPDNADYHVIIPAAGSSRRLVALTGRRPKSLLEVAGRPLVERSLEALDERGLRRVTFVVGYLREVLTATLGDRHGGLDIDYVVAEDYATTEHGWSLYLTKRAWLAGRRPVLLMDADNVYDPRLLDRVLAAPGDNVVLVEPALEAHAPEDELVIGEGGRVHGFRRTAPADCPEAAGVFVGMNRFSPAFMSDLYAFMDGFFASRGRRHKYERVLDAFLAAASSEVAYVGTAGLPWVNVNSERDYERAQAIARALDAVPEPLARERSAP